MNAPIPYSSVRQLKQVKSISSRPSTKTACAAEPSALKTEAKLKLNVAPSQHIYKNLQPLHIYGNAVPPKPVPSSTVQSHRSSVASPSLPNEPIARLTHVEEEPCTSIGIYEREYDVFEDLPLLKRL